ncbi:MAG: hypothetical protein DRP83_02400 [Planctomycetota bacterium]|nr:MAG: hypothetical protein DRP83_02400 [Planctomycetota bacterium]
MTARDAFTNELENRKSQLKKLRAALESQEEDNDDKDIQRALALLRRAEMSFAGAESHLAQGIWKDGLYLLSQGIWNLGCAHGLSRRL